MTKTFILECRETAARSNDILLARLMRDAADELHASCAKFATGFTAQNLIEVNAKWARAQRILVQLDAPPDSPSGGTSVAQQTLERMVA